MIANSYIPFFRNSEIFTEIFTENHHTVGT